MKANCKLNLVVSDPDIRTISPIANLIAGGKSGVKTAQFTY
jgi:hypothetical protein